MKKIDLRNYEFEGFDPKTNEKKLVPFVVKNAMVSILYHPALKLNGRDLLLTHKLATKISQCDEDIILLESVDYFKLVRAVETVKGFGKHEVEFARRVLEAEDVREEKK